MTYNEILDLVRTEFETMKEAPHCEIVKTGLTYDGCNGFCVAIYNYGDVVKITDLGETKEIFDQLTEAQWIDACTTNGFEFNHWRIERTFNSMEDLYEYIKFIDVISDTFFDDED